MTIATTGGTQTPGRLRACSIRRSVMTRPPMNSVVRVVLVERARRGPVRASEIDQDWTGAAAVAERHPEPRAVARRHIRDRHVDRGTGLERPRRDARPPEVDRPVARPGLCATRRVEE